jgi:hypothetical protein
MPSTLNPVNTSKDTGDFGLMRLIVTLSTVCLPALLMAAPHTFIIGPVKENMRHVLLETRIPKPRAITAPVLRDARTDKIVPCQIVTRGEVEVFWLVERLAAGDVREWKFSWSDKLAEGSDRVKFYGAGDRIDVAIDGEKFTSRHAGKDARVPFYYPVILDGKGLTRSFPMKSGVPGEKDDHAHHVSFWFAHGDVNGKDFWHGKKQTVVPIATDLQQNGSVLGILNERYDWLSEGKKILEDERSYRFIPLSEGGRAVDVLLTLKAVEGDVKFGDTKEGTFAIRVAGTMKGTSGGLMTSSEGKTREENVWGKPAAWIDYSGKIDGKNYGVAMFDHPGSFRHPTHWHARDYGLFGANPFGYHHFYRDDTRDGSHTMLKEASITFRFRVLFHRGNTAEAAIAEAYAGYARAPQVRTYLGAAR